MLHENKFHMVLRKKPLNTWAVLDQVSELEWDEIPCRDEFLFRQWALSSRCNLQQNRKKQYTEDQFHHMKLSTLNALRALEMST